MNDTHETSSHGNEQKVPTVPMHGNWAEERGFGQQVSPSSNPRQYDLKLTEPSSAPSSGGK